MPYCQYNFGENKIDTLPFFGELCLISIFVPISPKMKNQHKFNYLNLLMLNETILEMPYFQLKFGKNKLEVIPFWGNLGADFHIWDHWPEIEKNAIN